MSRNFSRRDQDRSVQRSLRNLSGRHLNEVDWDDEDLDFADSERYDTHAPRRFQHNTDDD